MTINLTTGQKKQFLPNLIKRDDGFKCFYCNCELELNHFVFDHLNCSRKDNRIDNLVLACQSCNIKRVTDGNLYEQGLAKLEHNETRLFVGENFLDNPEQIISKEIDINTKNTEITEQYISNLIIDQESALFSEALDACVYICQKQTGHGSNQSVRNYIAALTSVVGPFEIIRNEKNKKLIVKRR